jgi:YesN/AraC family two-component response regulator
MLASNRDPFTIVFVDDETHALTLFKHTLKEEVKSGRIRLLTFDNGEECVKHLKGHPSESVLMFSDINMPKMDGFSLLDRVRSIKPEIDMFFISAYDIDDYKIKADTLGAKGFLTKPVNFKAIKTIINSYIEA